MKSKDVLFALSAIVISFNSFSQISFEKGYFINNSSEKIECLIQNVDWKNNPSEFNYKLSESSGQKTASTQDVEEFGIDDVSKFKRCTVQIDRSSEITSKLGNVRGPIFKEEQLFLKVLIEGEAHLLLYEEQNLRRFFYKTDSIQMEQLIYKSYLTPERKITKNNTFRYQLWSNLNCNNISLEDSNKIDYTKKELIAFFIDYNTCSNSEFTNFENKKDKDFLNLSIRPGLNSSSLSIHGQTEHNARNTNFDTEFSFRIGLELEFILPFNKGKWTVLLEPTFQYYKSESSSYSYPYQPASVDYKSVEIPIGLRHHMFINKESKLFINALLFADFPLGDSLISFKYGGAEVVEINFGFGLGLGYNFKNKYSFELRYLGSRDLTDKWSTLNSDYKTLSLIFGYTFL